MARRNGTLSPATAPSRSASRPAQPTPCRAQLRTYANQLQLDGAVFQNIGPGRNFKYRSTSASMRRLEAVSGHDATDRVVFDTRPANLYYDADGDGAGPRGALRYASCPRLPLFLAAAAEHPRHQWPASDLILQGDYTNDSADRRRRQ